MQEGGPSNGGRITTSSLTLRAARAFVVRAPLFLPLLVVVGIILDSWAGWCCAIAGIALGALLRFPRILLCSILCGALVWTCQDCRTQSQQQLLAKMEGESVTLQGTVIASTPRSFVLETGWLGVRVEIRSDHIWLPGDVVRVVASRVQTQEPAVQGMYSAKNHLRGQGICGVFEASHAEKIETSFGMSRLRNFAAQCREKLTGCIMPSGTEDDARRQVLCALVLGEKKEATQETMDLFRRSGCLHAFAVSGLHVGIVAWLVGLLLRLFRVHPRINRIVILTATGIYVVITGMAVPALRAYTMLATLLGGLILRRRVSLANTWSCAALVVLLVQPWQFYQAGFQLSFAVYGAICLGVRYCMGDKPWFGPDDYLPFRLRNARERAQVALELALRGAVVVSLCAWIASLPLTMHLFHVVNTCSYLTNLALIPVLPVVMALGLLWISLGWVPLVGPALGNVALHGATLLLSIVGSFSELPGAYLSAQPPARADEGMVLCLPYGKSICTLGNPGLLIGDVGNEGDARYSVQPAIFHTGFSPVWTFGVEKDSPAGKIYAGSWPKMQLCTPKDLSAPLSLRTSAGTFSIYPAATNLPQRSSENRQPVVVWKRADGLRVLYIGNAAQSTLETVPPADRHAHVLLLGHNNREPIEDPGLLNEINPQRLILLPSFKRAKPPAFDSSAVLIEQLSLTGRPILRIPPAADRHQ